MAVPDLKAIARLSEMQEIASIRGGKCLSKSYINARTHLEWECSEGHQWRATPDQVKDGRNRSGSWCQKCARVRSRQKQLGSINELIELAASKGGKCLSTEYKGVKVHHLWECANGHQWEAVPLSMKGRPNKKGSWCPDCARVKKLTIDAMHYLARSRGGNCLSGTYTNNSTNLCWECHDGHTWDAPAARILSGGWCPHCNFSTGEKICRIYFETLFDKKFPPAHKRELEWLVSTNGVTSMELDGYCEELNLAFEHHGKHHYQKGRYSRKNQHALQETQERDERRRRLCAEHNVHLIEIPEIGSLTKISELKDLIIRSCRDLDIPIPKSNKNINFDIGKAFISDNEDRMKGIRRAAEEKGGKCITETYISSLTPMIWECAEGHRWETTANNILPRKNDPGTWCRVCGAISRGVQQRGQVRKQVYDNGIRPKEDESIISILQRIAESKGGLLISDQYTKDDELLTWQCDKGHEWDASAGSIKGTASRGGTWCPKCFESKKGETQRLCIEEMQEIAKSRGGRCLSDVYVNAKTKLKWECANGHQWEAIADTVKNRESWCRKCARSPQSSTNYLH